MGTHKMIINLYVFYLVDLLLKLRIDLPHETYDQNGPCDFLLFIVSVLRWRFFTQFRDVEF